MSVRLYTPSDDAALQALDLKLVTPLGGTWPYNRIKLGPFYKAAYATKAQAFPDSVILVAEEQDQIVGTVSAGIKEAVYIRESVVVACVFDLKTYPPSQDLQVKLMNELEKCLISKEVAASYCYISEDNEEELALYNQLGYSFVSERNIRVKTRKGLSMAVEKIPKAEGLALTRESYERRNMLPRDLDELFNSPHYKGTYSAHDSEGNIGALSLWDSSGRTSQTVLECCTEPGLLRKNWKFYLIFFGSVLLFHLWFLFWLFDIVEEALLQLLVLSFAMFTAVRIATVSCDLYNYFLLTFRNHKSRRARTFGLAYRGKFVNRDEILRKVIEGTITKAFTIGFDSVAFNIDNCDNDTRIYPKTKSKANVLLKSLLSYKFGRWAPQSFQDPREFSL